MMARPDLDDPEDLKAYRKELRAVGRPFTFAGLGLLLVGIVMMGSSKYGWLPYHVEGPDLTAFGVLLLGWGLMVWAFVKRNLYHRNRMAEPTA